MVFYSLVYWLLALVIVFPPDELVAAGLTVEALLGSRLGSELSSFIQYHIRRTAATVLVHSFLPLGYVSMLHTWQPEVIKWLEELSPHGPLLAVALSLIPVMGAVAFVLYCWKDNWRRHPLAKSLALYAPSNLTSANAWLSVATDINIEFRRIDKFTTRKNSVSRIVATDNWLIKTTSHKIYVTHLRDAVLSLEASQDNQLSPHYTTPTQLLTITVQVIKEGIQNFLIRLTAADYQQLEGRVVNPIVNAKQLMVEMSLSDRFFQVFTENVENNPRVESEQELEPCIGCMVKLANIKLQRRCGTVNAEQGCVNCYCRPMWCIMCLSKWFAARQKQDQPETWLSSRCPCPTCRSNFCILDVCLIPTVDGNT